MRCAVTISADKSPDVRGPTWTSWESVSVFAITPAGYSEIYLERGTSRLSRPPAPPFASNARERIIFALFATDRCSPYILHCFTINSSFKIKFLMINNVRDGQRMGRILRCLLRLVRLRNFQIHQSRREHITVKKIITNACLVIVALNSWSSIHAMLRIDHEAICTFERLME